MVKLIEDQETGSCLNIDAYEIYSTFYILKMLEKI